MENLVYDALRLIKKILSDTFEDNILVHISQTEYVVYSFPASPEIPTCYGYIVDRTPEYLEKNKVLKILFRGQYVVNGYNRLLTPEWQKRLFELSAKQVEDKYKNFAKKTFDFTQYGFYSPVQKNITISAARGLCFVVINRKKAEKWMNALKQKGSQKVNAPEERPYWYEKGQMYFRLADRSIDEFDFSKAEISRRIFEAFWSLWVADGKGEYTVEDIVKKYKEIHKMKLEASKIGEQVSNARSTIVKPKVNIKDRLEWKYDKSLNRWIFRLS